MIKTYCDRCGKEIKKAPDDVIAVPLKELGDAIRLIIKSIVYHRSRFSIVDRKTGKELELCGRCEKEFDRFMSKPHGPEEKEKTPEESRLIEVVEDDKPC